MVCVREPPLSWLALVLAGCFSVACHAGQAGQPQMVSVPPGEFWMGSTAEEREYGYRLDETLHGSTVARPAAMVRGRDPPPPRRARVIASTAIWSPMPTMRASSPGPGTASLLSDETTWRGYRLGFTATLPSSSSCGTVSTHRRAAKRIRWYSSAMPTPPPTAGWRGARLPSEAEWEKAARGTDGRYFPWGNVFDAQLLNSEDGGPFDTVPVGEYPDGQSPYGVLDMAGQVFEWTDTLFRKEQPRYVVKGGSWDDFPGVTRAAARHGRPPQLKHILVGFRCAASP